MKKIYVSVLTISFCFILQNGFGQNSQNDSLLHTGAKMFLLNVLKDLEPDMNSRIEDSLCLAWIPLDTIKARVKKSSSCINNQTGELDLSLLNTNSTGFEKYTYRIDSCCTRELEKNIFYLRVNLAYKDSLEHGRIRPFLYGYLWYKIWFDGDRYWLIPGHHTNDICIDLLWMKYNPRSGGMRYFDRHTPPW